MPVFDVVERHRTFVRASPAVVFRAIRDADLARGPLTRGLLALRAIPAMLTGFVQSPVALRAEMRARRATRRDGVRLADFDHAGFRVVAERPPDELVIGLLGRFWTPRGDLRKDVSLASFAVEPPSGLALAGWNFTVIRQADGSSELRTETRVRCSVAARASFRAYWFVVRPGSGLIRRAMLRAIRLEAERVTQRVERTRD